MIFVFPVICGFFENNRNVLCGTIMSINEPIVVNNSTDIFLTFGVPISYLYWMGIIEFFHWQNLHIWCYPRAAAVPDSHRRLALGCW
jgi:hypothetical protein